MKDFFNFRDQVQEDYSKDADKKKKQIVELEKDADDPCQPGWVQLGMKTKDGREVPNCVPMEEAKKQMNEGYYDYPDYGPIGASEMAQTQLHFIKYAADDVTRCLKAGCPMPEWYQNKLAKIEGDMEGLYSYMKGKTHKMKAHQSDRYGMGMSMYGESTLTEQAKSGDKDAYQKFFDKALKRFGADSPADLSKEKKKDFFDYVDKNWKSDKEESGDMSEAYISEKLNPSDDVSKWIKDFYDSDAPQFKGKDKEERREMAVAAWLDARREAGYDVGPNPNE